MKRVYFESLLTSLLQGHIEVGLDFNRNNILDVDEINTSYSIYVCNGNDGQDDSSGIVPPSDLSVGDLCWIKEVLKFVLLRNRIVSIPVVAHLTVVIWSIRPCPWSCSTINTSRSSRA